MPVRRGIIAGCFVVCLLLGGCAERRMQAEDLDFTFDCMVDVHCGSDDLNCSFQRTGPQNASVQILSGGPEGLAFHWNGDGFTQTYASLSAQSEACVLPKDAFAAVLTGTLDQAEKAGALTATHDGEFSGNAGYDFTLTADPATGKILTLSVPECGFRARFHDYAQKTVEAGLVLEPAPD